MNRFTFIQLILLILLMMGCYPDEQKAEQPKRDLGERLSEKQSETKVPEMEKLKNETKFQDFVVSLVSAKKVYKTGEKLDIIAHLTYAGSEAEVEIIYNSTPFSYIVTEHTRNIIIESEELDISERSVLRKGELLKKEFLKTGSHGEDPFYEQYFEEEGLPEGSYTITLKAHFA